MKTNGKKLLSLALALIFALGVIPFTALTAGAEPPYSVGEIIEFGGYPQSRVTDSATVAALNAKVKDSDWVSYGYYAGDGSVGSMEQGDWMKYCDIYLNGNKYRGVTFSQYRPTQSYKASSAENSLQDDHGYTTGINYWFLWETLRWRVLDPSAGLVLCESIIDVQAYQNETIKKSDNEYYIKTSPTVFANNYKSSSVRTWLNGSFYQTAFTSAQQAQIKKTTLNNDAYSSSYPQYGSASTSDSIFLLSASETLNTAYGFDANTSAYDPARNAQGTAYAKCQGIAIINNHSHWILRNAREPSNKISSVGAGGYLLSFDVTGTNLGIRPAFTFKSGIVESPFAVNCAHSELTYVNNGDYTHTAVCKTCDAHLYTETHESLDGRLEGTNDNAHRTYCGKCYNHVWIPHDQEAINRTVTGTCVTPTRVYYNCSFCGYLNTGYQDFETVPDRHVNTAEISETDSTCATPGYTAGVFCNDCQHYISGHVEKELAPHDWDYANAEFHWDGLTCTSATVTCINDESHTTDVDVTVTSVTTVTPGCESVGEKIYTASFTVGENVYTDPNTKTETLSATGHLHTTDVPETASTCIAHGYTAGVWCNDCETWISGHEEKPFADHTWDEGEITKPATCVAKGETTYACTVPGCGETKTVEDVAENLENHTGGTRTENEELVPGTCVAKKTWKEVVYCVSCGEPVSSTPKTGEKDPDNHVNTTEAGESDSSCTAHGYTAGVWCGDCETWISGHEEKPLVRHSYVGPEWKWNGTASAKAVFACTRCGDTQTVTAAISSETVKEPTDTEAGKKVYTATVEFEGNTYTDTLEKSIPALNEGLCKWCGERHEGFFGKILGFFHSVAYFFAHLFGRR